LCYSHSSISSQGSVVHEANDSFSELAG
jgi:hypothetical protein